MFLILLIISIVINSCNLDRKSKEKFAKKVNKYYDKEVIVINFDSVFYKGEFINKDQVNNLYLSGIKIVTYVDGQCHTCTEAFNEWEDLIKMAKNNKELSIYFYVKTNNTKDFKEYYYSESIFDYPIIIDKNDNFIKKNGLQGFEEPRTFLLNKENKIILVGNPIYGSKLMKLYKEQIIKRLKQ